MQAILWLAILVFCGALIISPRTDGMTDDAMRAQSVADEIMYYHVQATYICEEDSANCNAGRLNLTTRTGATSAYGARVVSFTDGVSYVATTVVLGASTDNLSMATQFSGWVTDALQQNLSTSDAVGEMVGLYSTSAQEAYVYPGYVGAETYATEYPISQGYGGITLINHQPILITPLYN